MIIITKDRFQNTISDKERAAFINATSVRKTKNGKVYRFRTKYPIMERFGETSMRETFVSFNGMCHLCEICEVSDKNGEVWFEMTLLLRCNKCTMAHIYRVINLPKDNFPKINRKRINVFVGVVLLCLVFLFFI